MRPLVWCTGGHYAEPDELVDGYCPRCYPTGPEDLCDTCPLLEMSTSAGDLYPWGHG